MNRELSDDRSIPSYRLIGRLTENRCSAILPSPCGRDQREGDKIDLESDFFQITLPLIPSHQGRGNESSENLYL